MRVDQTAVVFSRGAACVPAEGIATTPMGYVRDELLPGEPLPGIRASEISEALASCDEVVLSFDGKLGDTLLALGAVSAVLKYLLLVRPQRLPSVRVSGPHAALFEQLSESFEVSAGHFTPATATARVVVVGDRQGTSNAMHEGSVRFAALVLCDPEDPPCWSSGPHAYTSLPARYFLAVERRLGTRLDEGGSFMPILHETEVDAGTDPTTLNIGIVTATSWPARKDYGLPRIFETLRLLRDQCGRPIRALVVTGRENLPAPSELADAPAGVAVDLLHDAHYGIAAQNLATCDLVIGNDTGLTHLAAATRRPDGTGPQVIGLHARHSHTKWRTGLPWHHALATAFSEKMYREDRCPVRDRIDDRVFGAASDIGSITPGQLAEAAAEVLASVAGADR